MNRLPGLDNLRALAIVVVMLFHATGALPVALQPFAAYGWMGVDLFFVLSGYLIGAQLLKPYARGERPSWTDFYRRRAYRVLPAYLAVLGLYYAVPAWREARTLSPAWEFLTFTENLFIDYRVNQAFSHVWSLCIEEHFYLVLPLLAAPLLRSRRALGRTLAASSAIVLTGVAIRAYILLHILQPLGPASDDYGVVYIQKLYYPTYTRLDALLFGVLLAAAALFQPALWARLQRAATALNCAALALLGVALWLFHDRFDSATGSAAWATVVGFPLLALALALLVAGGTRTRWAIPGAKPVALLAYSLYLTHKEVIHLVRHLLPEFTDEHRWGALGLYVIACFTVATGLYFGVERPFLRLRDRGVRRVEVAALPDPAI